jgi:hypothetical protein
MPTWGWIILGIFVVAVVVAPFLGRHFEDLDDDWP